MKVSTRLLILLFLLCTGHTLFAQTKNDELEVHEEWRLNIDKDGIKIFTRWIEGDEGMKARQMKGEMNLEVPASNVVQLIKDDEKAVKWVNRAIAFENLKEIDPFNWYSYCEFDIPWPFNNQDLITRNELKVQNNEIEIHITGMPEYQPVKENINRIEKFSGAWLLTDEINQTKITYFIFTESKPVLPRWVIDPIVLNGFWHTLDEMRKILLQNPAEVNLPYLQMSETVD